MSDEVVRALEMKLQLVGNERELVKEQIRLEWNQVRKRMENLDWLRYREAQLDEEWASILVMFEKLAPYKAAEKYPVNESPVSEQTQLVKEQRREDQRRQRRLRRDRDMREAKKVYREELEAAGLDGVLLGLKPPKGRPSPEYLTEREKYGEVLLRCVNAGVKITQLAEITAWSKSAISELVGGAKAKAEKRTGLAA